KRFLHVHDVIEAAGLVEIHHQMRARATHAIANDEMIVAYLGSHDGRRIKTIFSSGGTWSLQALPRSKEGVSSHARSPNQRSNPRDRRAGSRSESAVTQASRRKRSHRV